MSRIDITAIDRGCGSRRNYIETFVDNAKYWPTSGDFLYPCTTTHLAFIEAAYINRFKVAGNQIYLNRTLHWSAPETYSDMGQKLVVVVIIIILAYFVIRRN